MNPKQFFKKNTFVVFLLLAAVIFYIAYKKTTEGFQQKPPMNPYIPVEPDCNKKGKCTCPNNYKYDENKKACLAKPICPMSGKSGKKQLRPVLIDGVCNTEFSVEV